MKLQVELTDDEAKALAQMCKRFGYHHAEMLADRYDGGRERELISDAVSALIRALAAAGFAPR